ncbi:MAG: DUF4350 domain-containing protein [Acidobacteria bacterium]|nr:DUF4350 domain-containing protein [Acidobacteriota bacterium]
MKILSTKIPAVAICVASLCAFTAGQQMADPTFDTSVARPAYAKRHPKILFDEAHDNFHTATGRYKPFAELMKSDGYDVTSNKAKFKAQTLAGYDVLVIANALGEEREDLPGVSTSAFTAEECYAVRDWVRAGGSLLLIADHAPYGSAAEGLASRFGVGMRQGFTNDPANHDADTGRQSFLLFSRDNQLLGEHAITRGRNAAERVKLVLSFTGQSLKGPPGSVVLLKLSDTAFDVKQPGDKEQTSAAGRAQGLAFRFGRGRVVVLGEAAMLSAQVIRGEPAQTSFGREEVQMGMNRKGTDDRQFALNIMHWLSRLLN